MTNFINKFRIPTLLGLSFIMVGIVAGTFLVLTNQTAFISQANPSIQPQNVIISNIEESQVVVSWETPKAVASFIRYGEDETFSQTVLDDRDQTSPATRKIHYATLRNLKPQTTYSLKIMPGEFTSEAFKFQTAVPPAIQNGFVPVTGIVLEGENPLNEGIAYLSISGAVTQSTLIKSSGNFLIPLSFTRKQDLTDVYPLIEDMTAKLTIVSDKGQTSALIKIKAEGTQMPPIKLGQDVDFTEEDLQPPSPSTQELDKFDLNKDGLINANDHAILLKNFGKSPQNKKADINGDGVVDKKDVEEISKKIQERGGIL